MLAFKHNAVGFGTPRTPDSDAETSGGPTSLHTAIGVEEFDKEHSHSEKFGF